MAKRATSYELWLREENIPIIEGYGIEDVTMLPRRSNTMARELVVPWSIDSRYCFISCSFQVDGRVPGHVDVSRTNARFVV